MQQGKWRDCNSEPLAVLGIEAHDSLEAARSRGRAGEVFLKPSSPDADGGWQIPKTEQTQLPTHGAAVLPSVKVDSYNLEVEDEEGFLGDKANRDAFWEIVDKWRKPFAVIRTPWR